jgi:plasmid stability protein
VDTTIRNLDEDAYRRLRARAVLTGRTTGEVVSEAIRSYLARPQAGDASSLVDLVPEDYGAGQERLSEEIDAVVYGASVSA